jgi:hypothetical protein
MLAIENYSRELSIHPYVQGGTQFSIPVAQQQPASAQETDLFGLGMEGIELPRNPLKLSNMMNHIFGDLFRSQGMTYMPSLRDFLASAEGGRHGEFDNLSALDSLSLFRYCTILIYSFANHCTILVQLLFYD